VTGAWTVGASSGMTCLTLGMSGWSV
jgi:hypothetical protein